MKGYSPYELYKSTDIRWLNNVPQHWEVKPLFGIANERKKKNTGLIENNVLSLSYGKIVRRNVDTDFGLLPASFETYNIVRPNNIVLRLTDLQNDKRSLRTGLAKEKGIITSAYVCLEILKAHSAEYIHYLLHAYDIEKVFYSMGGGVRQTMGYDDLRRLPITLPPKTEQKTIASFLDRQIGRIDTLIEKKQRLIELFQEKRQTIITQVVTKGLDPDVPMKDTGVEWLGRIPVHWEVKRLRHISEAIIGLTYDPDDVVNEGEGLLVLRASNVSNGHIVLKENVFVKKEIPSKLTTRVGDILICSRSGSRALIGKNAKIKKESAGLTFGAFMMVLRSTFNDFLFHVFNSKLFDYQSGAFMTSTINQLTVGNINNFKVPMPPADEQQQIAGFLDREIARIGNIINMTQMSIDLLQERRSALITAAVTGQIDVREAI